MIPSLITLLTPTSFTTVEHVRELQPSDAAPDNLPALFLVREKGNSLESSSSPKVRQQNFRIISIFLVCNYADQEALESELFASILGWQLTPKWGPLQHQEDEPVSINGEIIWHQYQFTTWQTIKQT